MGYYQNELAKIDMVLIDEADQMIEQLVPAEDHPRMAQQQPQQLKLLEGQADALSVYLYGMLGVTDPQAPQLVEIGRAHV